MAIALIGFIFTIVHSIFRLWFSVPLEGNVSIGGFILFVVFVAYSINKVFAMVRTESGNDTIIGYEESGVSGGKYYTKSGRKVISRKN